MRKWRIGLRSRHISDATPQGEAAGELPGVVAAGERLAPTTAPELVDRAPRASEAVWEREEARYRADREDPGDRREDPAEREDPATREDPANREDLANRDDPAEREDPADHDDPPGD